MIRDEQTIRFSVWPHLLMVEGDADKLAAVIEGLYKDPKLSRKEWAIGSAEHEGRLAAVQRLRTRGKGRSRIGLAALTRPVSDVIESRARASGLKCVAMHVPSR
jgi:hypothetical protein